MSCPIQEAVAKLPSGPLTEESIRRHIAPLFTRTLANEHIYLANHSLGRPLDQMAEDMREGMALWETKLGDAWDEWLAEQEAFRERIATLIGAPRADCVVPKTSAGQGLRAVLNALPNTLRVLSTRGEFDSVDLILKQYAALGRIEVLNTLNVMHLKTPHSAILSAVIFNAIIIIALVPLALRGVKYEPKSAQALLRRNLIIYGVGGVIVPFVGIKLIDVVLNGLHLI